MTTADFSVTGSVSGLHPSSSFGAAVINGETLSFQLEVSPGLDVQRAEFEVVLMSHAGATVLTLSNGGVPTPTPLDVVTAVVPASPEITSYLVRCRINGGMSTDNKVVADWTRSRIIAIHKGGLRKIVPSERTEYDPTYGWVEPFNSLIDVFVARTAAIPIFGMTGRSMKADNAVETIGGLTLRLGTVKRGLPTAGRTLSLEAILHTSLAAVGSSVDFYNHTTGLVVGSTLVSVADVVPELVTLDVTAQVGTSLTEDAVNNISVRHWQTNLNAAERAYCDSAAIVPEYL